MQLRNLREVQKQMDDIIILCEKLRYQLSCILCETLD